MNKKEEQVKTQKFKGRNKKVNNEPEIMLENEMENIAKSTEHVKSSKSSRKERARKKRKKKDVVTMIILVIASCVFVFSLFMLVDSVLPYFEGGKEYDEVKELVITQEKVGGEDGDEVIFRVNFDLLLEQNADTIGWIRFDEPSIINYPVVKSTDNDEYLTRTFTANDNKLGSIFMDMNCASDYTDRNTIIYGHNMNIGGEMFSQLNSYKDESFCQQYPYFYIYTPDNKVLTYQIFSAGVIKDVAENYRLDFPTDEDFMNFIEACKASSNYAVDVELDASSKVVTLSTCTNVRDDERFVVHGVLISEEYNN